ncbi:MAG TPA: cupin domain-containing protein [Vulgatibacter sp.]|nr:cupin domain-containing protein [Vulgatibacter sp.]
MIHFDVHHEKGERFKILRTTDRTQITMMTLPPNGTASSTEANTASDQIVYLVEGRIELTVGDDKRELRAGEGAVIPASTTYSLRVLGRRSATLFNVYGPPAFPAEDRESARAEAGVGMSEYDRGGF